MAEIVISEFMDEAAIDGLREAFDVHYSPDLVEQPARLEKALNDVKALIVRNRTQVDAALLDCAPVLGIVGRLGVGLDNIDLAACDKRGIRVQPATGANDIAVAEYVITTALVLLRGAYQATNTVLAGEWPRQQCMGAEVFDKRLALVGCGAIARETAVRAQALGMQVSAFDPLLGADDAIWQSITRAKNLDALLEDADVVSIHVPLTETTRGLFDQRTLAKMKPGAVLINTSRGGVVDEAALREALYNGQLDGAAIDVFAEEPLDKRAATPFAEVPNLILTPHIAGVTKEANVRVSAMVAAHIADFLRGKA